MALHCGRLLFVVESVFSNSCSPDFHYKTYNNIIAR